MGKTGHNFKQQYQFTDKPERIPHFQKCLHGDSEQAGPTGSASCAAGCSVYKSDGSLHSTERVILQSKWGYWGDEKCTVKKAPLPHR